MKTSDRMEKVMSVLFEQCGDRAPTDLTVLQIAWTIDENVIVQQDEICEDNHVYVFSDWSRYVY